MADIAEELRYLMDRFPSMRTLIRTDAHQWPTQELFEHGTTHLEVYEAEAHTDPGQLAAAIEEHWRQTPFDYAHEWPVRMAVVCRDGLTVHLVTIMSHLVTDAAGAELMLSQVKVRDSAPATGLQQLEQARWQASAAGQRQNAMALRYWEKVLRSVPAQRFPASKDPRAPRFWSCALDSKALHAALPVIAARTGADTRTVLVALFAICVHRITALNPVLVRPVVGNRFRPGLGDVVCTIAQSGALMVDLSDTAGTKGGAEPGERERTVDQAVEQVRRTTLALFKHAYFHPQALEALIGTLSRERGEQIQTAVFFNDRSSHLAAPDHVAPAAGELVEMLDQARRESHFRWTAARDGRATCCTSASRTPPPVACASTSTRTPTPSPRQTRKHWPAASRMLPSRPRPTPAPSPGHRASESTRPGDRALRRSHRAQCTATPSRGTATALSSYTCDLTATPWQSPSLRPASRLARSGNCP
ncbi:condensation domain-containing protein [Streptacidiphilus sp. PAMC 29251]